MVQGGPDGGDFGDVRWAQVCGVGMSYSVQLLPGRDPSPVEGAYNPQAGKVMMCVDGTPGEEV